MTSSPLRRLATIAAAGGALFAAALLPAQAATGAATAAPPPPQVPVPAPGTGALMGFQAEMSPTGDAMPPGIVNAPCTPAPEHPYPVVLVHGTFANEAFSWQTLAPMLSNAGYCVFGLNYGAGDWTSYSNNHTYGVDVVEHSAAQLKAFIETTVLPDTFEPAGNAAGLPTGANATQVDVVGHSQGGMMPRYLIDSTGDATYPGLDAAALVHTLVGLAPSNHGTTMGGLVTLGQALGAISGNPSAPYDFGSSGGCGACGEQEEGSPFLRALDAHADAPRVSYYVIETSFDEVVTPYTNAFLPGDANVQDVTLQDQCPTDATDHVGIIYDPVALQDVMAALADNGPTADPLPAPACPPAVAPVVSG